MAKCKYCGRSGWFLSVTDEGLCKSCNPIVIRDIVQRKRDVGHQAKYINLPGDFEGKVRRCDVAIQHLSVLADYQRRGIPIRDLNPSSLLREYQMGRERILVKGLEKFVSETLMKADLATSAKTKISQASNALFKLRNYKDQISKPQQLEALETAAKDFIHRTQLNAYLEAAKKAEFKGQRKKALDQYREALYFLKHDEIDDKLQTSNIGPIEQKIAELEKGP